MTDERLEKMICKALPQIRPSEELNRKILAALDAKNEKGFHARRLVVLAAACMMLLSSITVLAATVYYSAVMNGEFYTKDYRKIAVAEEKIGCDIKFVRNFFCGYAFEYMETKEHVTFTSVPGEDEVGEYVTDYTSVLISYSGEKGQVNLYCRKAAEEDGNVREAEGKRVAGVDVIYNTTVIEDAEIGVMIISVEGEEAEEYEAIQDITYCSATWVQDGVYYEMIALPDAATEEELFSMVEELILSE